MDRSGLSAFATLVLSTMATSPLVGQNVPVDTVPYQDQYPGGMFMPQLFVSSALDGGSQQGPLRFTPLCFEIFMNSDYSHHLGAYMSAAYRQLGYIRDMDDGSRMKFRTWNVSAALGVKAGNMERGLVFGGYRFEWPFHYRERRFVDDERVEVSGGWVSKRTPTFSHALEFGYQFRAGVAVRFEYYLSTFHRESFSEVVDDQTVHPYAGWNDHLVGVSCLWRPFQNVVKEDRFKIF